MQHEPITPISNAVPITHGYYKKLVESQVPSDTPNYRGPFDIFDIDTDSGKRVTGRLGALDLRYALYWIANYGLGGHTYTIHHRYHAQRIGNFTITL